MHTFNLDGKNIFSRAVCCRQLNQISLCSGSFAIIDEAGTQTGICTIDGPLSAKTVSLTAPGGITGAYVQGVNSQIVASSLTMTSAGGISLLTTSVSTLTISTSTMNLFTNTLPVKLEATTTGDLSLFNGGAITIPGTMTVGGSLDLSANGNITITGATNVSGDYSLAAGSGTNGTITIKGNVGSAGGTTTLAADGKGSIIQKGGLIFGSTISLSSGFGNIGTFSSALQTSSGGTITLETGASGKKLGTVFVDNNVSGVTINSQSGGMSEISTLGSLTVDTDVCGSGNCSIVSTNGLTVGTVTSSGPANSATGTIYLVTLGGSLQVTGEVLARGGGSILLENWDTTNGTISIGAGALLQTNATIARAGQIWVVLGPVPKNPVPGSPPSDVTVTNPQFVYYGTNGISTNVTNTNVQINAMGRTIIFNTGSAPGTAILLNNGSEISAAGYRRQVPSAEWEIVDTGESDANEKDQSAQVASFNSR